MEEAREQVDDERWEKMESTEERALFVEDIEEIDEFEAW